MNIATIAPVSSPALVDLRLCYGRKSVPVEFEQLDVALPPSTRSYVPVGHQDLVSLIKGQLVDSGLQIVQESYVLWRNGQRMFGLMQVNHPDLQSADHAMIVGVRNSFDKSLPAMITSGNQVFVCDNLMFNGEIVLGRKHTKNIFADLAGLVEGAMETLFGNWRSHLGRINAYREYGVCDSQAHDLIAEAFRAGALSKTQIADAIEQWHTPNHTEFSDRNLWSLHNAFTEVWKGRLDLLPTNSAILQRRFDGVAGYLPEA